MRNFKQVSDVSQESPPAQIYVTSGGGAIIVIVNLLLAIVIIYATSQNGQAAVAGIVGAVIAFGTITPVSLMALNGSWAQIVDSVQEHITLRHGYTLQAKQGEGWQVVDHPRLPDKPPTETLPAPTRFVPAIAPADQSVERTALAWLWQLYGDKGQPDPSKVLVKTDKPDQVGRIRIAGPSKEAKQWLLDRRVIFNIGTAYRLNLTRFPDLETARQRLSPTPVQVGYATNLTTHHHPVASGEGGAL